MTCTLVAGGLVCNDTVHPVSVTAGDRISIRVITSNAGAGSLTRAMASVEFKTTTSVFSSQWSTGADGVTISYATTSGRFRSVPLRHMAAFTIWGSNISAGTKAFEIANNASTSIFSVTNDGNAALSGTLTQGSDLRLKGDVTPLASTTLDAILKLRPVTYTRIDQASSTVAIRSYCPGGGQCIS